MTATPCAAPDPVAVATTLLTLLHNAELVPLDAVEAAANRIDALATSLAGQPTAAATRIPDALFTEVLALAHREFARGMAFGVAAAQVHRALAGPERPG